LIKDLLQHQKVRVSARNQLLEGMYQKMWVELGSLRNEPQTDLNLGLQTAALSLCMPIYERYKAAAE